MTKLNKKGKIVIALSAVGLVIILVGVWLLVGFFVPPTRYKLIAYLTSPHDYESEVPFDENTLCVGDKICIDTTLYNNKSFFYQKILYADNGPIYCQITIQTEEGTKIEYLELLTYWEYENYEPRVRPETVPYTTIEIEQLDNNGYAYQYGTARIAEYEFAEAGTYTFTCYAAFMQCGQSFYVEQTPGESMTVTVIE